MTRTSRVLSPARATLLLTIMVAIGLQPPATAQIDAWIDPGHGGKDPGASGIDGSATPNEEDLNLQVSSVVKSRLGQLGWLALMTRNSDFYWTKTRRTLITAGLRPNDQGDQEPGTCCASVHMNAVPDSTVFGTKVIFPAVKVFKKSRRAYGPDSSLGAYVKPALLSNTPLAFMGCNRDLGLTKDIRELTLLQKSRVPTVIVECCFISNRCQFDKIKLSGNQGLVGNGIATGVANYLGSLAPNVPSVAVLAEHPVPYSLTTPLVAGPKRRCRAAAQASRTPGIARRIRSTWRWGWGQRSSKASRRARSTSG